MTDRAILERLAALPGVRGACLATPEGALLDGAGGSAEALADAAAVAADALGAGREVGEVYGDGAARAVTVEYATGSFLVVPVGETPEASLLALNLESRAAVGRARREVARAAPRLARAPVRE